MNNHWLEFEKALVQKKFYKARKGLIENDLIDQALNDFFEADIRRSQLYAHLFDRLKKNHCQLLQPYYVEWIRRVKESSFDAFLRNSYRHFQYADIPNDLQGELYDMAFQRFMDPQTAIAIRVFAMTTCYNISKSYPELQHELREAILLINKEKISAGMRSRSRKLLSKIESSMS